MEGNDYDVRTCKGKINCFYIAIIFFALLSMMILPFIR